MKISILAFLALLLAGCATQNGNYNWGGYDNLLYDAYKDPTKVEQMRIGLEALVAQQERSNQKVAPGIYAELGTLYYQSGDSARALSMYERERDAWPESKGMMTALIANINRRSKPSAHAEKQS